MKIPSSLGFNLFIDEDTADLLVLFVNLYMEFEETEGKNDFQPMAVKARETFKKFHKSVVGPIHELGWCKDPDCGYESDPNLIL